MIRGKLFRSYLRDGEHPNTILNGCVWHNDLFNDFLSILRVCIRMGQHLGSGVMTSSGNLIPVLFLTALPYNKQRQESLEGKMGDT